MSTNPTPVPGTIGWHDLTVPNAVAVRDFYSAVVGWKSSAVDMDVYEDFCMTPSSGGDPVTGICHARGGNAGLPAQWLIYIHVADIEASLTECSRRGGVVVAGPKDLGGGRFAVIRDPAGAVAALYQAPPPEA
jgi:predicted enzyme related to lactoylglutathione lyase